MVNKENDTLNIYSYTWGGDIFELKKWVDNQIKNGNNKVNLEISWGYYDDIDGLVLDAEK